MVSSCQKTATQASPLQMQTAPIGAANAVEDCSALSSGFLSGTGARARGFGGHGGVHALGEAAALAAGGVAVDRPFHRDAVEDAGYFFEFFAGFFEIAGAQGGEKGFDL